MSQRYEFELSDNGWEGIEHFVPKAQTERPALMQSCGLFEVVLNGKIFPAVIHLIKVYTAVFANA